MSMLGMCHTSRKSWVERCLLLNPYQLGSSLMALFSGALARLPFHTKRLCRQVAPT